MVSDAELVNRLREFLRTSDLTTTTTAIVRRKLEEEFGVDLTEKKAFIREQVDLFLQSQLEKSEEEDEEVEEVEEEEEEEEDEKPKIKGKAENDGELGGGGESEEEGEEEEEEAEEEKTSNGKRRKKEVKMEKDVKKRGGGFAKLCSLSPQLQKFLGVPELPRTEVVKQLWAYIREKNLQDPNNKRNILCDEALRDVFHVDTINMFQMNKALSKHIWPLESEDGTSAKSTLKEKQQKQEKREGSSEPKPKEKRQKGGGSGFLAPLPLSDALMKFIGTGENALSRGDVVKRIWDYIKQHNLQDPSDKRRIICDDRLKELFEVDSFHGFTVPKLLSAHFIKSEQ